MDYGTRVRSAPYSQRKPLGSSLCQGAGASQGTAIKYFIRHFRPYGRDWVCIDPATLDGPQGRIQVASGTILVLGTKFMNVDLAQLLDDERTREERA